MYNERLSLEVEFWVVFTTFSDQKIFLGMWKEGYAMFYTLFVLFSLVVVLVSCAWQSNPRKEIFQGFATCLAFVALLSTFSHYGLLPASGNLATKLRDMYCQIATERLKSGRAIADADKYKNECVEALRAR